MLCVPPLLRRAAAAASSHQHQQQSEHAARDCIELCREWSVANQYHVANHRHSVSFPTAVSRRHDVAEPPVSTTKHDADSGGGNYHRRTVHYGDGFWKMFMNGYNGGTNGHNAAVPKNDAKKKHSNSKQQQQQPCTNQLNARSREPFDSRRSRNSTDLSGESFTDNCSSSGSGGVAAAEACYNHTKSARRRRLRSQGGFYLAVLTNGLIMGVKDSLNPHTELDVIPVGADLVKIWAVEAELFLMIDDAGQMRGTDVDSAECVFRETLTESFFNVYYSTAYQHKRWSVALRQQRQQNPPTTWYHRRRAAEKQANSADATFTLEIVKRRCSTSSVCSSSDASSGKMT